MQLAKKRRTGIVLTTTVGYHMAQHYTMLYYTTLHYTTLHYTTLHQAVIHVTCVRTLQQQLP